MYFILFGYLEKSAGNRLYFILFGVLSNMIAQLQPIPERLKFSTKESIIHDPVSAVKRVHTYNSIFSSLTAER